MIPKKTDLVIRQGNTFEFNFYVETVPLVSKLITAITQAAPAVLTVSSHGVPDGWRVAVVSANGMKDINAQNYPPNDSEMVRATVIDPNTIELNLVNSADWKAYTGGGYLVYWTPLDMTSYTARMSIKDKIGGTELLRLDTANLRLSVDAATSRVIATLSEAETDQITTWFKGVYDLEVESPLGVVLTPFAGSVRVDKQVTST